MTWEARRTGHDWTCHLRASDVPAALYWKPVRQVLLCEHLPLLAQSFSHRLPVSARGC